MILTDREIQTAIKCGQISIAPLPSEESFSSTSVDLTLAAQGTIWQTPQGVEIRPGAPGYNYQNIRSFQRAITLDRYPVQPGQMILGWTTERIDLPATSRIAARVEGKSAISRLGLGVHVTAPTIHAGFRGPIQLEMCNLSKHVIVLDAGMKICQIIFEQTLGTPVSGYSGVFQNQSP